MKQVPLLSSVILLSLLTACASVDQSAQQTAAAEALAAELAAAQAESALQTAEDENAALQATNDALSTQSAGQSQPTATQEGLASSTPQPSPTRTLPVATQGPTNEPGISAQLDSIKTCEGTQFAIVRVRNVGPETYQSAIVKLSDANGDEIRRSDGNNEFLPAATCPGNETPALGPGEEKFVAVSVAGTSTGDTLMIRVTVCTEKGYGGNCWSSAISFVR
jgi:hypothetical protein